MTGSIVGRAHAMSLVGLDATPVLIEAVLLNGLPSFTIVGLPDTAVNEARERLRAGFAHIGLSWPNKRLTVNLSPAGVSKSGAGFDLGLATAIIGALGFRVPPSNTVIIGELGLDASVRPVHGVLPTVLAARERGFTRCIVPTANGDEARLVEDLEVRCIDHLSQLASICGIADVQPTPPRHPSAGIVPADIPPIPDLADVCGQEEAVEALEIAAAGRHHMLMVGPPGVGKSMLAHRLPGILPDLSADEAVEVAAIQSVFGQPLTTLPSRPPLAAPHHSASLASLVGGGSGVPRPGEITRAHRGVLFCDEFPEFATHVIQSLRQPMESGFIDISRARAHVRYPAQFQLIAAANPCKCGMALDGSGKCTCTPREKRSYRQQLGGPVRDRIDIRLALMRPSRADLVRGGTTTTEQSATRVAQARERQQWRFADTGVTTNAQLPGRWLRKHSPAQGPMLAMLDEALLRGELSMRGVDRIMRLAWTIADIENHDRPTDDDLARAFALRAR